MMKDSRLCLTEDQTSVSSRSIRKRGWWKRRTYLEKKLCLYTIFITSICVGLSVCAVWYYITFLAPGISHNKNKGHRQNLTTNMPTTSPLVSTRTSTIKTTTDNVASTAKPDVNSQPKLCLTEGCVRAASKLLENMDQTVDPCEDFYEFACGGYIDRTNIPDDKTKVSQFAKLSEELTYKIKGIIEQPVDDDDTVTDEFVKDFYASCMNLTRIREIGVKPLFDLLDAVGGWPVLVGDKWNDTGLTWQEIAYRLDGQYMPSGAFIVLSIIRDFKNNSKHVFVLSEPSPGFPASYLRKGKNDSKVEDHLLFMIETAVFLGANRTDAEKEMEDVVDFEMELLKILKGPHEKTKNISKIYNEMNVSQLYQLNADMNWKEYMENMFPYKIDESEPIIVTLGSNFTKNFTELYQRTNIRTLANFAIGRMVRAIIPYLSEEYGDLHFDIFKKLSGVQRRSPRWERCMGQTRQEFPEAVGSMYVRNFFKPQAKKNVMQIVELIRKEMKAIIGNISWADKETIERAKQKLDAVVAHVAYPDELLDEDKVEEIYGNITIERDNFFGNILQLAKLNTDLYKEKLRQPVERNNWKRRAGVAVVNAFYNSLDNCIALPAGILRGIFYDYDRPQYMNFATVGAVVGHELTHGFDNTGRQFDENGHLVDWWQPETSEKFKARSKCMVDQYSNRVDPVTEEKLDGEKTLGENIADNGGLKEAYYAYRTWAKNREPELQLPGLNYTVNQLFWISYANVWCIKQRPKSAKLQIEFGVHSLSRFRVNVPLSNMEAFARDFQCLKNSPLNPAERCSIW